MLSKEKFLELASAKYEKVKELKNIKSFYDYEKAFDEINYKRIFNNFVCILNSILGVFFKINLIP